MFTFFTLGTILSIIAGILFILMIPFKIMLSGAILLLSRLDRRVDKSFRKKIAEYGGSGRGAVGTTAQVAGGAVQAGGKGVEVAGKGTKVAGKGVEAVGTTAKVGGKITSGVGKGTQYAGKGVQAGGKGVQAAGEAITVIPYVGTVIGGIVKVGGKGVEVGGKGVEYAGKGVEYTGKGVQYVGKGTQKVGQGTQKVGDVVTDAGGRIQGAGASIASIGADGGGSTAGAGLNIARLSTRLAIKALKLFIRAIRFILSLIELLIPIIIAIITLLGVIGVMIVAAIVAAAAACIFVVMGGGYTGTGTNSDGTKIVADGTDTSTDMSAQELESWLKSCSEVWYFQCENFTNSYAFTECEKEINGKKIYFHNVCSGYVRNALAYHGVGKPSDWIWFASCPDYDELKFFMSHEAGETYSRPKDNGDTYSNTLSAEQKEAIEKYWDIFYYEDYKSGKYKPQAGDICWYVDTTTEHQNGKHTQIFAGFDDDDGKVCYWNWGRGYATTDASDCKINGQTYKAYKTNYTDYDTYIAGSGEDHCIRMWSRLKGTTSGGASVVGSNANWISSIYTVCGAMSQDWHNKHGANSYQSHIVDDVLPLKGNYPLTQALADSIKDTHIKKITGDCCGFVNACYWYYSNGYAKSSWSGGCPDGYFPLHINASAGNSDGELMKYATTGEKTGELNTDGGTWFFEHFEVHTKKEVEEGKYKPVAGDVAYLANKGHVEIYMGEIDGKPYKCNFGGSSSINSQADQAEKGSKTPQVSIESTSSDYFKTIGIWVHCKDK